MKRKKSKQHLLHTYSSNILSAMFTNHSFFFPSYQNEMILLFFLFKTDALFSSLDQSGLDHDQKEELNIKSFPFLPILNKANLSLPQLKEKLRKEQLSHKPWSHPHPPPYPHPHPHPFARLSITCWRGTKDAQYGDLSDICRPERRVRYIQAWQRLCLIMAGAHNSQRKHVPRR